jgi:hypothetical protein
MCRRRGSRWQWLRRGWSDVSSSYSTLQLLIWRKAKVLNRGVRGERPQSTRREFPGALKHDWLTRGLSTTHKMTVLI